MSTKTASYARVSSADYRPNEFDRKRIERAIAERKRYRYVSPSVHPVERGYVVRSPCCSRNVDPSGGVVDVALLQYGDAPQPWLLYRKDHASQEWHLHAAYERLVELLEHLNVDPTRRFWQ
jgi:hypothetical protein